MDDRRSNSEDRRSNNGAKFSITVGKEATHRPNPYELYQKIEDLDTRFREHVDKEEGFWEDMTEMKMQISSMFLAATWVAKITKTLFVVAVTLTPIGVAAYSWVIKH